MQSFELETLMNFLTLMLILRTLSGLIYNAATHGLILCDSKELFGLESNIRRMVIRKTNDRNRWWNIDSSCISKIEPMSQTSFLRHTAVQVPLRGYSLINLHTTTAWSQVLNYPVQRYNTDAVLSMQNVDKNIVVDCVAALRSRATCISDVTS